MKTITLNQISSVVSDRLSAIQAGTCETANLLFTTPSWYYVSLRGFDRPEGFIQLSELYPQSFYDDKDGISVKMDQYAFDDNDLKRISENDSILLLTHLNWGRDPKGDDLLVQLIRDRSFKTFMGNEYDLSKLKMVVAFAYPEDGTNRTFPFSELKDLFEEYDVRIIIQEEAEKEYNSYKKRLPFKDKDDDVEKTKVRMEIADQIRKWPEPIDLTKNFNDFVLKETLREVNSKEDFLKKVKSLDPEPEIISMMEQLFG